MSVTIIIIAITSVVSIIAFSNKEMFEKLKFNAYRIHNDKEWYRIFTHALLHANWMHLIINMLVFFSFGRVVEYYFAYYFGSKGTLFYVVLYITAILFSVLYSLNKQKNNIFYNAVGASGAVSAVVFTAIFFDPWNMLYFFGMIPIPGIVFGIGYLIYSYIMGKRDKGFIAHDVHFWGSVYGFVFPLLIKHQLIWLFLHKLIGG